MDGDGVIQVNLTSPHFYGDGEALDDLIGALTDYMEAHNSFLGTLHDELEGGGFLVMFLDHTEIEGLEGRFINLHRVSVFLASLWLGQANGPHRGVREDNGSDIFIVELVILEFRRSIETVGKPPPSSDGDRSQEPLSSNIPDGSYTWNVGVLVLVDDDVTLGSGLNTESVQTEVLGICLTADRPQENVGLDRVALIGVDGQVSWFTFDLCDLCLSVEFDTCVLHPRSENFLDGRVKSPEDGVTTDEEVGLRSEGVEDTGEFDGDITGTDDDDSFRLVLEVEETIRGNTKVGSRNLFFRGDGRVPSNSDANMVGLDGVGFLTRLGDPDLSGGEDGSMTVEEVDALPVPVGLVDTTQSLDVSIALGLEGCPVELWLTKTLELVSCGMTKLVSEIGGMPHQLLGNASDVDASATVVRGGFDDCDFLSVRGSATSSSRATAATSNEDDVVLFSKLDWGHLG